MNIAQIVEDVRAFMRDYLPPVGPIERSCLWHATALMLRIHQHEPHCCLNAGAAGWRCVHPQFDDSEGDLYFEFPYSGVFDDGDREIISSGNVAGHVWVVLPSSGIVIDIMTTYAETLARQEGVKWQNHVAPSMIWRHMNRINGDEDFGYQAAHSACDLAHRGSIDIVMSNRGAFNRLRMGNYTGEIMASTFVKDERNAVRVAFIRHERDIESIVAAGGVIVPTNENPYEIEYELRKSDEIVPPRADGTFSDTVYDGSSIYIPTESERSTLLAFNQDGYKS